MKPDTPETTLFPSVFDLIGEISQRFYWLMGFGPLNWIWQGLYRIYFYLMIFPMYYLYLYGPALQGYGFWNGKTYPQICSSLSSVHDDQFWATDGNRQKCEEMILQHFSAFVSLITFFFYMLMLKWILGYAVQFFNNKVTQIAENLAKRGTQQRTRPRKRMFRVRNSSSGELPHLKASVITYSESSSSSEEITTIESEK